MTRSLLGGTAVLLAVAVAATPRPTAARPPADTPPVTRPPADTPADLKLVPPDAAVFAHVDVEKIWASPLGDTFRKVHAKEIDAGLKKVKEVSGLTPADVKTFTFFVPKVRVDGPPPFGMIIATKKPYDREKIVAELKKQDKDGVEALPGNKYRIDKRTVLDLGDPTSVRVFSQYDEVKAAAADPAGPLAPALKAAAAGSPAVLGVAFGNLPDEIRQENVPAEVRPFQPLFFTDAGILTADFVKDELVFTVKFKGPNRAKAVEAEKSLGALKTLVVTALGFALQELEKDKAATNLRMIDFVKDVRATAQAARITNDDNTPAVTLAAKADVDYAPFLEFVFGKVGGASDRMMSVNNLKQIALAMHNYLDVYNTFPPAAVVGRKGKPLLSWRVMLLPYLDHNELYKKFRLDEPWDSPHNKKVLDENPMPRVYLTTGGTAKPEEKKTHYQGFVGNGAFFDLIQGGKIADISDGTSNTVMIATAKTPVVWTKPDDLEFDPKADPRDVLLFVGDVSNVAFADGSVRAITNKVPADTWRAVITRAGGEVVALP